MKKKYYFYFPSILFFAAVYFFYYKEVFNVKKLIDFNSVTATESNFTINGNTKIIYIWTGLFGKKSKVLEGWGINLKRINSILSKKEEQFKCYVTQNETLFESSDVVVYIPFYDIFFTAPERKFNNQIFIFLWNEPPLYTYFNLKRFKPNLFNWTASYRRDSDIYFPYGRIIHKNKNDEKFNFTKLIQMKNRNKIAASLISDCNVYSNREGYINELKKYIKIDIYGKCGSLKCGLDTCYQILGKQYKFWLSFENSFCYDYITEKFFNPLAYGAVPIVFGMGNYSKIAPPYSYIDVNSFKTPKDLSIFLNYLNENDEAYLRYFEWRKKFKVETSSFQSNWRRLCKEIHLQRIKKQYNDIDYWWNKRPNQNSGSESESGSFQTFQESLKSKPKDACIKEKPEKLLKKILNFLS